MTRRKDKEMSPRDRRLLELLAQGLPNKAIAKKMGYKHGTTRVYLHQLYRTIGVAGKTAAVVWYIDHLGAARHQATPRSQLASAAPPEESIGHFALRTNLFTALGSMGLLVGPYGRLWEVAARLKGSEASTEERRRRARGLWEALLRGDFAYARRVHDDSEQLRQALESAAESVPLAILLWFGGYTAAATRVSSHISRAKQGPHRVSTRELHLVEAVRDIVEGKNPDALERIHRCASDAPAHTPTRHLATAALFHAYVAQGELERAQRTAQALWAEAEASRQHLHSMGERVFTQDVSLPRPAAGAVAPASRHREEVTGR